MIKAVSVGLVALFLLTSFPLVAVAGDSSAASNDTAMDRVSDWFATVGKPQDEKDMIIAQRRMERATDRAAEIWKKESKKAAKKMQEFGKEMEKAFK